MDFEPREIRLRVGTCPSCSKEFAFLEGSEVPSRSSPPAPQAGAAEQESEESEETEVEGPECDECGSPLSVREGKAGTLEVSCSECETTTVYIPKRESGRPGRAEESRGRFSSEGPRSRPCRQCGAPLRFSTGDDGSIVGECDSCGNRFTLPPRSDRGRNGGGFRGRPGSGGRDYRSGPRGRPYYRGGGGDRAGPSYRRRDRRGPPRDDDDRRKRRRRDD